MKKKVEVTDHSVKEVVLGLAESLGVEHEQEHNEYCINIPDALGSGFMKAYEFDFGFGVIESDFTLKKDLHFELERGIVHPLKIMFNRESAFKHKFEEDNEYIDVKHLECLIVSGSATNNHKFTLPAGRPICILSLEINRKLFEDKIISYVKHMDASLIDIFRDLNGVNNFFHKGHYSLETATLLEEFTDCELDGMMRQVYLEGKAYEIFSHQITQYKEDIREPDKRTLLRQSTIDSIEKASKIIRQEMDVPINVTSLAKRVGLSQNTLQSGFRKLHKKSVNEFIRSYRIEAAKELIEKSNLNITEITYKVGINSRSYFSKLFKKKYGVTPKDYLEKTRKERGSNKSA